MQLTSSKFRLNRIQSRSFSDLMWLYEQNHRLLQRLLPDLTDIGNTAISVVPGHQDLHYRLLENCKYTTTFCLTHVFERSDAESEAASREIAEPNLIIRQYHDARLAEVISGVLRRCQYQFQQPVDGLLIADTSVLQTKWRLNRFLYKWLCFCLNQGHILLPKTSARDMQHQILDGLVAN